MFGQNKILRQELHQPDGTLWVQEVFPTIQGEGPFVGEPALFIRMAGCCLRCTWCDTDFESSTWHPSLPELLARVKDEVNTPNFTTGLVVITGGEPLRQNIAPLCKELIAQDFTVQIETAGTLWIPQLEELLDYEQPNLFLVVSPKTGKVHPKISQYAKDWKYITRVGEQDLQDGLPSTSTQVLGAKQRLARPLRGDVTIWLQPCEEYFPTRQSDAARTKNNMDLAADLVMKHGYRLSLQIHKIVGLR